ncbi:MAG: FkbM family methyltransferase [Phenylobacterium sp.]|jgi:FkbM family methyltransferase
MNYEQILESFYSEIVVDGDLVIDIGAHSGRHSKPLAALVSPKGKVMAFEPNPVARSWLESNVWEEINANVVTVLPYAVSNENCRATFTIANERPEESGLAVRTYNGPTTTSEVEVDVIRLDSKFNDLAGAVTFIKLDVEGAEFEALKGAQKILETYHPVVAFEFGASSYEAYDVQPADVFDYLEGLDYTPYSILGERLDRASFVTASKVQSFWDYIACPTKKIKVVEAAFKNIKDKN